MPHKVVSEQEWIAARKVLLAKEKALSKERDRLNAERRELPWVKVDTSYVFDGPNGKETLGDLFASFTKEDIAAGNTIYNYDPHGKTGRGRGPRHQRILQGRAWRDLPHLFVVCAGRRPADRRLQLSRPCPEGPQRRFRSQGLGASP